MIVQRSSLNRMGSFFTTGWWDSGFDNKMGGIIRPSIDILIAPNTRVAQFIAFSSESASMYNGIYKRQN
jgi:deoxycytidine triphosphate deaminase